MKPKSALKNIREEATGNLKASRQAVKSFSRILSAVNAIKRDVYWLPQAEAKLRKNKFYFIRAIFSHICDGNIVNTVGPVMYAKWRGNRFDAIGTYKTSSGQSHDVLVEATNKF